MGSSRLRVQKTKQLIQPDRCTWTHFHSSLSIPRASNTRLQSEYLHANVKLCSLYILFNHLIESNAISGLSFICYKYAVCI